MEHKVFLGGTDERDVAGKLGRRKPDAPTRADLDAGERTPPARAK